MEAIDNDASLSTAEREDAKRRVTGGKAQKAPTLASVIFPKNRYGKKVRKHAKEWGLDPASAADRQTFHDIVDGVIQEPDEVIEADNWRDQPAPQYYYYIRDEDVVVVNGDGESVTLLKGGVNNERVKRVRNQVREYSERG